MHVDPNSATSMEQPVSVSRVVELNKKAESYVWDTRENVDVASACQSFQIIQNLNCFQHPFQRQKTALEIQMTAALPTLPNSIL